MGSSETSDEDGQIGLMAGSRERVIYSKYTYPLSE